ncbi:hypothetical protein [Mucilaginibacter aquariorum]|uniref:Uncharacterized protein n=1 Tax=Mucilaginibacter aquariorum TaxID=2967225 RepID=A0ABT1SZ52_9SPHI|nr:hypothetical protein [Mucilaginibacter aquariorum]MCQ6957617.1 hypothetical protein [Mucilaginibacter aquariorum]
MAISSTTAFRHSLRAIGGKMEMTMLASAPMIAMAALCFKGGENFKLKDIGDPNGIEVNLPDVLILLGPGKMVAKTYEIVEPKSES